MAGSRKDNLKIKTVPNVGFEEELTFSPEEMQPFEVVEALESDLITGKTPKQVKKARRLFGVNEIRDEFSLSFLDSIKNQLKGLIGAFLAAASLIMYLFERSEKTYLILSIAIVLITIANAVAEYRASIALQLPKKYSSLKARVIRSGEEMLMDSRGLVPGDIISVEEGMMVPADCRLIDGMNLFVLETHVSGVKGSVQKDSRYLAENGSEALSMNMIYAGSIVTQGHASAIVCRIGKETLFKRIRDDKDGYVPPILKYVRSVCRTVSIASVILCFVLLFFGVFAGADITRLFISSLAIGASSLCDSMVSLCAASLGFGAKEMAEDGMVVKNYGCIQKLARTNTIMCGKNLAFPPVRITLTGLYFSCKNYDREKRPDTDAEELLKLMLVCSDARRITAAEKKQKRGLPEYKGSPIDDAIVDYFIEWNKPIGLIREQYIRMDAEYTLSGDISRLLALHNGKNTIIVRGSPENILSRCAGYTLDGTDYKLSDFTRKKILSAVEDSARTNSVLVAVACGETEAETLRDIDAEQRLIFKGFISFESSLDAGVASSVYRCETAGIETVLNSDDAYYAALNSAKSAGIINDEAQIITAEEIRSCNRGLFIANAPYYKMFLSVDDNEWLDIVHLRRENRRITAVTAERINELPIMSEADVSIVPEGSGDTLRQTADVLMLGKGLNLIADGILNAKTICRRIYSVVSYLPVASLVMFVGSLFAAFYSKNPAFRAQDVMFGGIIFNLAFAFALAFEPRNVKNLKSKFPPARKAPIFNDFIYPLMFGVGGGIALFVCFVSTQSYTCTMLSLTLLMFLYACSVGGHGGFFVTKRFGSRLLWLVGFCVLVIAAILTNTPFGKSFFEYETPNPAKLIVAFVIVGAYFALAQIARYLFSKDGKKYLIKLKAKWEASKKESPIDEGDISEEFEQNGNIIDFSEYVEEIDYDDDKDELDADVFNEDDDAREFDRDFDQNDYRDSQLQIFMNAETIDLSQTINYNDKKENERSTDDGTDNG